MAQVDPLSPIPDRLGRPLRTFQSSGSILPRIQTGGLALFGLFVLGLCAIPDVARQMPVYLAPSGFRPPSSRRQPNRRCCDQSVRASIPLPAPCPSARRRH